VRRRHDRFGSAEHLVSWAGICPGTNQSGGKRRSGKTRHGDHWRRTALSEAARAASRTRPTYLASHYWHFLLSSKTKTRLGHASTAGAEDDETRL
jgi:transposase